MSDLEPISARSCGILAGIVLVIGAVGSGCSFDSGLQGSQCEQNGEREAGRVCRGGYWVELDDVDGGDSGPVDGGAVDSGPDNCNYEG
ncbi:MAG: hypothetical protein ABEN55_00775, partial [Bradymonadaceae bacterium]